MSRKPEYEFTAAEDAVIITRSQAGYYDRLIAEELGLPMRLVYLRRLKLGVKKIKRTATGWGTDLHPNKESAGAMDALIEMEKAYATFVEAAAAFLEKARNGRD